MSLLSLMSVFTEIAYKWWTFLLLFSIIPLPSQLLNACKRSGKMVRNKLLSVIPSNPFQRLWRRWGDEWIKDFPNSKKRRIKKKWEGEESDRSFVSHPHLFSPSYHLPSSLSPLGLWRWGRVKRWPQPHSSSLPVSLPSTADGKRLERRDKETGKEGMGRDSM